MSSPNQHPIVPVHLSISPTMISIAFGATVQLTATLTGSDGLPFSPTASFVYSSSNTALLTVNSSGLCTAVTPPVHQLNTGGLVSVSVTYPFSNRTDNETISAVSAIKILANSVVSAKVPQAPAFDLTYCENNTSGAPQGGTGWKNISQ
jgi:hypothetical protein